MLALLAAGRRGRATRPGECRWRPRKESCFSYTHSIPSRIMKSKNLHVGQRACLVAGGGDRRWGSSSPRRCPGGTCLRPHSSPGQGSSTELAYAAAGRGLRARAGIWSVVSGAPGAALVTRGRPAWPGLRGQRRASSGVGARAIAGPRRPGCRCDGGTGRAALLARRKRRRLPAKHAPDNLDAGRAAPDRRRWPLSRAHAAQRNHHPQRSGPPPERIEALVVAASRDAARPLVAFLRREKLNVTVVQDTESAFEEALLHRPNVVIIDEALPPPAARSVRAAQGQQPDPLSAHHLLRRGATGTPARPAERRLLAIRAGADALLVRGHRRGGRARLWALLRSEAAAPPAGAQAEGPGDGAQGARAVAGDLRARSAERGGGAAGQLRVPGADRAGPVGGA